MAITLATLPWDHPVQRAFLYAGFASAIVVILPSFLDPRISVKSQRRIYWSASLAAAVCAYFSFYPIWKTGIIVALFILGVVTATAYFNSPYIKINGKVYALTVQDSGVEVSPPAQGDSDFDPAPDAYSGIVTAKKWWWIAVPLLAMCAVNAYFVIVANDRDWRSISAMALLAILALGTGYGDSSWEYPIARGQYVQFGIITVITAGSFAALYLIAYWAAKHWPVRLKRSMEYRAHPRHQK
jgi:hypothetical protein